MSIYVVLGVDVGNFEGEREPMESRVRRINHALAEVGSELRIIDFYRHTGNLVVESSKLPGEEVGRRISSVDRDRWTAIPATTMRKYVDEVGRLPLPPPEPGYEGEPGILFAVAPPTEGIRRFSSEHARFHPLDTTTIAAWKRDRVTPEGRGTRSAATGVGARCQARRQRALEAAGPHMRNARFGLRVR